MYSNFNEAKKACVSDKNCDKIYDTDCDQSGKFNLCDKNAKVQHVATSCIYQKSHYNSGNYF